MQKWQKSLVAQEFLGGMADSRTGEELPVAALPEASGSEGKEIWIPTRLVYFRVC